MKVNISYSVDLEEVLSSAFSLYKQESARAEKSYEELKNGLGNNIEDDNLIEALQAIQKYRESSQRFHEKLLEINNILIGYAQIRYKQDADNPQTQETPREVEND
jgi:hypothetical protein